MIQQTVSRIFKLAILGTIFLASLSAEANTSAAKQTQPREILLEGKASYFVTTNKRFKDIYGGAGLYRLETNIQTWRDLYTWVSLGYLYKRGHSSQGNRTSIHLAPLSFGVSYLFKLKYWTPYVGLGPLIAYSHIHNHSPFVTAHQNGWGGGFLTKIGFITYIADNVFFDFFADYSLIAMSFSHGTKETVKHSVNLNGFSFGGGLGYRF